MLNVRNRIAEEADRLRQRIVEIEERLVELDSAVKVLDEFAESSNEEPTATDTEAGHDPLPPQATEDARPTPTVAIRDLFEAEPQRQWKPMELSVRLKVMLDNNELNTTSLKDPVERTHTILRDLTKQGFIVKHQPVPKSHKSYYVKAVPEP